MLDTLKIAGGLSEGDVFTHEQAERLANALATYWKEVRSELVSKEYLDARLSQLEASVSALEARLEAKFETKLAQVQNRILASQVALFVLLGIAIPAEVAFTESGRRRRAGGRHAAGRARRWLPQAGMSELPS